MRALRVIYTIWLRELTTFFRERSRIIGMVGQPVLYLLIVGLGLTASMSLNRTPAGVHYVTFMYPGIIGMSVLFTSIYSAISIIWDREFGFLKEVLVAPVPRWGVAAGKVLGGATVAVTQSLIIIALGPVVGVYLSIARVVELVLLSFLMSLAMTSLGVAIAARMESMQGFQMIMNLLVMPLYFLSGAIFPVSLAPTWMKSLMIIDPLSYGVDALRNVVFRGTEVTVAGAQVSLIEVGRQVGLVRWNLATDVAVMAGVAVVLAAVGAYSFSRAE